mmetsp:Transcript_22338/g.21581  ORF Transcript_22338/g.21581 Transcript_22338/m.21581 type:complete len:94 (-) Transcript_22338:110-391(-)
MFIIHQHMVFIIFLYTYFIIFKHIVNILAHLNELADSDHRYLLFLRPDYGTPPPLHTDLGENFALDCSFALAAPVSDYFVPLDSVRNYCYHNS